MLVGRFCSERTNVLLFRLSLYLTLALSALRRIWRRLFFLLDELTDHGIKLATTIRLLVKDLQVFFVELADSCAAAGAGHWQTHLFPDSFPPATGGDETGAAALDDENEQSLEIDLLAAIGGKLGESDAFSFVELDQDFLERLARVALL